jgi:GT2 family glycosyltransferase
MIAILLLTYNNLESTKKCIEKLYSNTNSRFSLFILDNYSTDGTVEYLKDLQYDNIKVYFREDNLGIINGRNRLYELSQSDDYKYLMFLDNDQFVQKGWDDIYLRMMDGWVEA